MSNDGFPSDPNGDFSRPYDKSYALSGKIMLSAINNILQYCWRDQHVIPTLCIHAFYKIPLTLRTATAILKPHTVSQYSVMQ